MALRAFLNDKPILAIAACGLMLTVATGSMIRYLKNAGPHKVTQVYFTADEGNTWFADSVEKIPPFDHDGQEAVRVYLYRCEGGTPFVTYLQRFTKDGKNQAEKIWADAHAKADATGEPIQVNHMVLDALAMTAAEVKKPGETQWYRTAKAPASVMRIDCPADTDVPASTVMGARRLRRTYALVRNTDFAPDTPTTHLLGRGVCNTNSTLADGSLKFADNRQIKMSEVRRTSETLLMVEYPLDQNVIGYGGYGVADTAANQTIQLSKPLHGTRFNYLFCDGHVDLLNPIQTIGTGTLTNPLGMWTRVDGD